MADGNPALFEPSEPDPARARIERRLDMLETLAGYGLEVAAAVAARAREAGPEEDLNALAMAYSRAARAVRLTALLQSKLAEAPAAPARLDPRREAEEHAKDRVARIVHRVITAEHDDEDRIERLDAEMIERLDDEDCYGAVLTRPMSEMVADICADLGLNPDWTALARECWALEEIRSGDVGEPLAPYLPREAAGGGPLADPGAKPGEERAVEGAGLSHYPSISPLPNSS